MVVFLGSLIGFTNSAMPGGISDNERPVTPEFRKQLLVVEPELKIKVAEQTNGPVSSLTPVAYKSQVVAGANYFVKYRIGDSDKYIHAKIYRDLQNNWELKKVSGIKTEADPIRFI